MSEETKAPGSSRSTAYIKHGLGWLLIAVVVFAIGASIAGSNSGSFGNLAYTVVALISLAAIVRGIYLLLRGLFTDS